MMRRIIILLVAAAVIAAAGAGFPCLFPLRAKADTFGQVIWGQQQGTTSASNAILDPSGTNVSIGTLDTVARKVTPGLSTLFPLGITYPSPTFTGTVTFDTSMVTFSSAVTLASPILSGDPTAPTPVITDDSTSIATTAFVRASALCQNAVHLGFVADGITDNLAAWNAWVAAQGKDSACLYFPASAKAYMFSASATAALASGQAISVQGSGKDTTEWWFPNATNGFAFTFAEPSPAWFSGSTINIDGGSITTSNAGGFSGLLLSGNGFVGQVAKIKHVQNVFFRGHTASGYWGTALNIQGVQGVVANDLVIYGLEGVFNKGIGIVLNGPNMTNQGLLLYVSDSVFTFLDKAAVMSGFWQGATFEAVFIEGVTTGITCGDGSNPNAASQCGVLGSAIETAKGAIILNNPGGAVISGNQFIQGYRAGALTTDFMVSLTSSPLTVISNNTFFGTTLGGGGLPSCVDISNGNGSSGTAITGNGFDMCTTTEKYSASSTDIASTGNAITGTPSYAGVVCGTSGNVILDAGAPAQVCAPLSTTLLKDIGAIPAISACGTSPSIAANSTNGFGTFTTGTASPTSCTLTLAAPAWTTKAACIVQNQTGASPTGFATVSGSTVSITFSGAANSQQFGYICQGQ